MPSGVLAFDLSPSLCGWSFAGTDGSLVADAFQLPALGGDLGGLALALEGIVDPLIHRFDPAMLAYEAPLLLRHDTLLDLRRIYGLGMVLELVAARAGLDIQEMDPKRIKSTVTGDAYAKKKLVADTLEARLGVNLPSTPALGRLDAGDATGCAIIQLSILDPAAASPHLAKLRGSLL